VKVTSVATISVKEYPNLIWVEVGTDEGLVGLGETFFGADAVVGHIHELAAPYLLGKDPLNIERHWHELYGYYRSGGIGAEARACSAIDNSLWDLLGQASGLPLYALLGGRTREAIRAYNTCAGSSYARDRIKGTLNNDDWSKVQRGAMYEDLDAFRYRADELAASLLEDGFTAMKIWPFDDLAVPSDGMVVLPSDLERGLAPLVKIRDAVGSRIEVAIEMHSRWGLTAAKQIARACEAYEPMWFEDPTRTENLQTLVRFARSTRIPTIASELLAGKGHFQAILESGAFGYLMFDLGWVGGLTEARKLAAMADAYDLPFTPHDCTGPVNLALGVHLGVSQPNAAWQEVVRAYYHTWYNDVVTGLPELKDGYLYPLTGPGLGLSLDPSVRKRPDASIQVSS